MYIADSWGMVTLPAADIQALVDVLADAIASLTSQTEHTDCDDIADQLALALDIILDIDPQGA
jgi:hypothetical protein